MVYLNGYPYPYDYQYNEQWQLGNGVRVDPFGTAYFTVQDSAGNLCGTSKTFVVHDTVAPNAHFVTPLVNTRLHLPYVIQVAAADNGGLGAAVLTLYSHNGGLLDTIAIVPRLLREDPLLVREDPPLVLEDRLLVGEPLVA